MYVSVLDSETFCGTNLDQFILLHIHCCITKPGVNAAQYKPQARRCAPTSGEGIGTQSPRCDTHGRCPEVKSHI